MTWRHHVENIVYGGGAQYRSVKLKAMKNAIIWQILANMRAKAAGAGSETSAMAPS